MLVEQCRKRGIRYLTLFSFSTENWGRAKEEVDGLMSLFRQYLESELPGLLENDIRLRAIGDLSRLPLPVRTALQRDMEKTKDNTGLDLVLAVSYGSTQEIVRAARSLASLVKQGKLTPEKIDDKAFRSALYTHDIPDPDLLIRTSGEMRLSNFLLYQLAYTEIVVAPELWPEFDEAAFERCIAEYAGRERRFGLEKAPSAAAVGA
jgi:undecaprenyl diphosphate synthase